MEERGAIRAADVYGLTGSRAAGGAVVGEWLVTDTLRASVEASVVEALAAFHAERPLDAGADLSVARRAVVAVLRAARAPADAALADALLDDLSERGVTSQEAATIRLASHRVALEDRSADIDRLLAAISGAAEADAAYRQGADRGRRRP